MRDFYGLSCANHTFDHYYNDDSVWNLDWYSFNKTLIFLLFSLITTGNLISGQQPYNRRNPKPGLIKTTICVTISFLLLPVIITILALFAIIRLVVAIILRIRHGNRYVGLLEGVDTIWALEDQSRSIINILAIIDSDDDTSTLRQSIKEHFQRQLSNYPKFLCTRNKSYGYNYLMNSNLDLDELIKIVDVRVSDKNSLQHFLSERANSEMPSNNQALWELSVLNKRIAWTDDGREYYTLILRIHHSLLDGVSLIRFVLNALSDELPRLPQANISSPPNICGLFKQLLFDLATILCAPAIIMLQSTARRPDMNRLHGKKLSGNKILVWNTESERNFIPIVKNIKNRSMTNFSNVVLTAIAASLSEYYRKDVDSIPESVTAVLPALMDLTLKNDDFSLNNRNFSVGMLNLPIDKNINLRRLLNDVYDEAYVLKNSPDYKVNYWLLSIVAAVLPEKLLKPMLESAHATMIVSNLPGFEQLSVCDGKLLNDVVFWVPHRGNTGVGFSILTYNNRFQLGMMIDKALISDENEAQLILDNIFKYLQLLHIEYVN